MTTTMPTPIADPKRHEKKAKEPAPVKPDWLMPKPEEGDVVFWYDHPDGLDPAPAFVTRVDARSVELSVLIPTAMTFLAKAGVRFRHDPDKTAIMNQGDGVWDFREGSVQMQELLKDITGATEKIIMNPLRAMANRVMQQEKRLQALEEILLKKNPVV